MIALVKRKDLNSNLPYCFLLLNVGNEFYQIPIISDIYDKNIQQTINFPPCPTPWDEPNNLLERKGNLKILDLTSTEKISNETTVFILGYKDIFKENKTMTWETVIGLEIHVQLNTKSKIFSGASTAFGAEPNAHASVVECALPGVLPVMNREVVEKAIKLGLALDAKINQKNVFDRKNYFYPDLPKGYQISQLDLPIVEHGKLEIVVGDEVKTINVTRAHMEEDAGKSVHEGLNGATGIDLNRAGTPLLEVVSEPEMRSAAEAVAYAKALHGLVTWLDICDGNMAEGSFRIDANVSVRPKGQSEFGTRREIKNLNSFRFLEQAINYEVESQIEIIEDGGKVQQATMLFDPDKGETRVMRLKEDAHDYRYFPDPDLLPVIISDGQMQAAKAAMPELPKEMAARFVADYSVSDYDARLLTATRAQAAFFEQAAQQSGQGKLTANWMNGELAATLNKEGLSLSESPIQADRLAGLVAKIADGTLSSKLAKQVFEAMWGSDLGAEAIIERDGLKQMTDTGAIEKIIDEVLANNAKSVEEYKAGKEKAFNALVGQVMKASRGKANPQQVQELMKAKLQ